MHVVQMQARHLLPACTCPRTNLLISVYPCTLPTSLLPHCADRPPPLVPPIVCDCTDHGVNCFADPCGVADTSPCKGQAGYQCVSNYCSNPTTYLGETIEGPCGAIYVNTAALKLAPECNPGRLRGGGARPVAVSVT
jgi:hypothetical protein